MNLDHESTEVNRAGVVAHDNIANIYKYRAPYLDDFFIKLSMKLNFDENMCALDLCCGRGEVAVGIQQYANKIYAVDGSTEMLANAIKKDNIFYYKADANIGQLPFSEKFENIFIGTAIHWLSDRALKSIIKSHLYVNGKVIIIHRLFRFDEQEFHLPLNKLNYKFGKRDNFSLDFTGLSKLEKCGFKPIDQLRIVTEVKFDVNYLYLNQLSLAYNEFYKNITQEESAYKTEFMDKILPFAKNGHLKAKLINWAIIYDEAR